MTNNIENDEIIMNLYNYMKNLNSFYPNLILNNKFEQLVNYCISSAKENDNIVINGKVLEINDFCSKAEFELEKFWASKIINSLDATKELNKFPYYENYLKLVKLEILNISYFMNTISNTLFIGGGPLPLTSIILAKYYGISSNIIDISDEAVEISKKLIKSLGLESKIKIYNYDANIYMDNTKYDFISIASLVFQQNDCSVLFSNINKNINFDILLTRSSDGIRQLLYKKIETNILKNIFDIKIEIHPKNDLINSIILSTKK